MFIIKFIRILSLSLIPVASSIAIKRDDATNETVITTELYASIPPGQKGAVDVSALNWTVRET
jgi:hypothetical protein